jgi:hypothetical protein
MSGRLKRVDEDQLSLVAGITLVNSSASPTAGVNILSAQRAEIILTAHPNKPRTWKGNN